MDARKGNIYEILNGNKQFLIPVYQRFYSWDIDQCKRLWNDIVDMQKKEKAGHFVGSIVNIAEQAMPTGVQKYMIIDGQQRMTTLTLLLLALRDYAIKNPGDTTINSRRIDNMLLKNEYEVGDERYKLLLTETDRDILISLVEEKPIAEGIRSRLIENYTFFTGKLADKEIQPAEVYESIGKLQIVNITLDRTVDDAQAIFESLNSTGKELSESDLIRNYVLMGLEPSEQTYVYEHLWRPMEQLFVYETQGTVMDAFFRHYLTMKPNYFLNVLHASQQVSFSSRQFRGITYLKEVVENMDHVMTLPGGAYNFGSETTQSMYEITEQFLQLLGKDVQLQDALPRHNLWMNCEKARKYGVEFSDVSDGLKRCLNDYKTVDK